MHTEQQNYGEEGDHPGEDPSRASTGSATQSLLTPIP